MERRTALFDFGFLGSTDRVQSRGLDFDGGAFAGGRHLDVVVVDEEESP